MSVLLSSSSHFLSGVDPPWSANTVLDISGSLNLHSILGGAMFSSSFLPGDSDLDRREKALKERIKSRKRAFKPGIPLGPIKTGGNVRRASTPEPENPLKHDFSFRSKTPPLVRSTPQGLYNVVERDDLCPESADYPSVWILDLPLNPGPSRPAPKSECGIGMSPQPVSCSLSAHLDDQPDPTSSTKRAPTPPPESAQQSPRHSFHPMPWPGTDAWHEEQLELRPFVDSEPCHNTRILREFAFNDQMAVLEKFHPHRTKIMSRFNPMRSNMAHAVYQLRLNELPKKFRRFQEPWHPPIRSRSFCERLTPAINLPKLKQYVLNECRHCPYCMRDTMGKKLLIWRFHHAEHNANNGIGPLHKTGDKFDLEQRRRILQWSNDSIANSSSDSLSSASSSTTSSDYFQCDHHEIKLTGLGLEFGYSSDTDVSAWQEDAVMDICEPGDNFRFDPYGSVSTISYPQRIGFGGVGKLSKDELSRPKTHPIVSESESDVDSEIGTESAGSDQSSPTSPYLGIVMEIMEESDDDDWDQRVPDSPHIRDMDSFDSEDEDMDMEDALMF